MALYDATIRTTLQQGERFRWIQSLKEIIDDNEFPTGLAGVVVYATIVNPDREVVKRFEAVSLQNDTTNVTFTLGGSVSENWEIGSFYLMQILFSNGLDTSKVITRTINIKVKEGFVRSTALVSGQGGFSKVEFDNNEFHTGAGGTT